MARCKKYIETVEARLRVHSEYIGQLEVPPLLPCGAFVVGRDWRPGSPWRCAGSQCVCTGCDGTVAPLSHTSLGALDCKQCKAGHRILLGRGCR